MVPPDTAGPDDAFLAVFAGEAGGAPVSFARFMEIALFHPHVGYYRRDAARVGFSPAADFYTSASTGAVFGELIAAAAVQLLPTGSAASHTFVEIGAEPGASVLEGVAHPFRAVRTLRLGDPLEIEGPSVVFSNELFDAQPCHRLAWRAGAWRETGVELRDGRLQEVELPAWSEPVRQFSAALPAAAAEGYRLDLPLAAAALCDRIVGQPWTGAFIACDYGKTWSVLADETPAGTVRAYARHQQRPQLLDAPGRQDLTCHICWDWLEASLARTGFRRRRLDHQESFLMHFAREAIATIVRRPSGPADRRRSLLHELLHPALLGQKFQVLSASRDEVPPSH